jgi:ATP-binding cassette subfamily B protein
MTLVGALTNVPPVVLGKLLDRVVNASKIQFWDAWPFLTVILSSILVCEAIQVVRRYLVEDTCTRVEKDVRVDAVSHLLRLDLGFFINQQVGAVHGRLNRSIEGLVKLVKLCFLDFLPAAFIAVFALGVALYRAPLLGVVMGLVIPVGILVVMRQVESQKGIRVSLLRGKEDIDGTVVELLRGIENVRVMNTNDFETSRVEKVAERLRAKEIKHHVWMAIYDAIKYLNEGIFHVLVLGLSIWLAAMGTISTGDILTYSLLFLGVIRPLREIHRMLDEAHESSIRAQDLFELTDLPEDRSFCPISVVPARSLGNNQPAVSISGLCFSYTESCEPIIDNLNLVIQSGEFIGICGLTGCGKSTLLKILLRLIHPQQGDILIYGRNIESMTREEIADIVGYVGQHPFIVSGTIYENIAYGIENAILEDVEDAACRANIHNEIISFPMGYQTQVGECGAKLSGGQQQRLALARVFLRSPSILILDEATSALDNMSEKAVQIAIEELMVGKTVIAVAHRLTTIRNADRIIVLDKGKEVESGTYLSLLKTDGVFSNLASASTGTKCSILVPSIQA